MKPVAILPSLCTLGNAFCGFLAVAKGADAISLLWQAPTPPPAETLAQFHHLFATSCWLIFLANIFDALDGRLARMAGATSDFGAMLDSLCDMLTFGATPALLLKFLFETERRMAEQPFSPKFVTFVCFLYCCCAALRLARFTAETDDDADSHDFFKGLPTPAGACFVASGILFYLYLTADPDAPRWLAERKGLVLTALLASMPLLALLMVSRVKYVHVVNRFMRGRQAYTYIAQIVLVLLALALVQEYAIVLLCMGYVVACPSVSLLEIVLKRRLWPAPSKSSEGGAP